MKSSLSLINWQGGKSMAKIRSIEELNQLAATYRKATDKVAKRILVCAGTGCVANGSLLVYDALKPWKIRCSRSI